LQLICEYAASTVQKLPLDVIRALVGHQKDSGIGVVQIMGRAVIVPEGH